MLVFFARLIPEKGIFDLIKIWKEVKKELNNTKLVICGKFYNKNIENKFLSMKSDDVIYVGFLPIEELYNTVAKARVFIYPTHFDSFSLVMLESLATRTPVVAYGLPAIAEIYGNLNAVRLVKEFDIKNTAKEVY
ncbi:glycosyltransferase family 4 protein [Sulfurisphaera tokodaii]|uniref:Glycosyltransferase n=1 Tax=Sulfurisphaera tokodaii (strain DSM 16993 / JCM 10545 / NBRC 100140 / 7) TaxID=273063 RepID=Q973L4_SULTO|nr:glycosyltransferase family 4 protein [Sulfurisphaera tokodaii]BAB65898.1 putative glycosyltransferase [Sulfurisphaera tokodaii str. 7]